MIDDIFDPFVKLLFLVILFGCVYICGCTLIDIIKMLKGNIKCTYRLRYKHPDCKINFKEGTYNYFWTAKIAKIIYQANYPNRKYWISKSERY